MKFNEWLEYVKSVNGVDVDGYYSKQCLDLTNHYFKNVIGLEGNTGADYAKNLIHNKYLLENCDLIENTLEFIPQKGDVFVNCGYTYGHTGVCLGEGDINRFKVIDQNFDGKCSLLEGYRDYVSGTPLYFLRPHNQENIVESIIEQPVEAPVEPQKSVDELAQEVIAGKWGNGEDRKNNLENAGYDYGAIQNRVNEMLSAQETIEEIRVGDKVKVLNATQYNGQPFKTWYDVYDVIEVAGDRVVIGIGNEVTCAININNIQKV